MDNFKIPILEKTEQEKTDTGIMGQAKELKKFYDIVQFKCLPCHLGLASAMKNYWIFLYDIVSPQKIL